MLEAEAHHPSEDDAEDDHHQERVEHRPQDAEGRPLVAHLQVAGDEVREQRPVLDDLTRGVEDGIQWAREGRTGTRRAPRPQPDDSGAGYGVARLPSWWPLGAPAIDRSADGRGLPSGCRWARTAGEMVERQSRRQPGERARTAGEDGRWRRAEEGNRGRAVQVAGGLPRKSVERWTEPLRELQTSRSLRSPSKASSRWVIGSARPRRHSLRSRRRCRWRRTSTARPHHSEPRSRRSRRWRRQSPRIPVELSTNATQSRRHRAPIVDEGPHATARDDPAITVSRASAARHRDIPAP